VRSGAGTIVRARKTGALKLAKLRHIAIAAEDPYATAEFYKKAFDFVEVRRTAPQGEGKSFSERWNDQHRDPSLRLGSGPWS
jgi:catechol 2,3-dioxygenase-like lactoylglutathione lyase family enzyme